MGFNEFRDYFSNKDNYSEIILDTNYRSTQSILNFSDEVVKNNSFRFRSNPLISNKEVDSKVVLFSGDKDMQLAKILEISQRHIRAGTSPSNICILTRNGSNAIEISNYLNAFNVKNSYTSGKLFENDCVKDFIAFLNVIFNDKYSEIGLYRLLSKSKYKDMLNQQGIFSDIKRTFQINNSLEDHLYNNNFLRYLYLDSKTLKLDEIIQSFINFSNQFLMDEYDNSVIGLLSEILEKYNLIYREKVSGNICEYLNTMFALNDFYIEKDTNNRESISVMTGASFTG